MPQRCMAWQIRNLGSHLFAGEAELPGSKACDAASLRGPPLFISASWRAPKRGRHCTEVVHLAACSLLRTHHAMLHTAEERWMYDWDP